jgi:predicted MFS family arabinose efflux permease
MVTDWFAGREIVTAMSVMLTSWPLGIAAGLLAFGPVVQAHGWAWVMYLAAGSCLAALVAIAWLYGSPEAEPANRASPAPVRSTFAFPPALEALPVIVAGSAWGALNLGLIAYFSFVPPRLVAHGLSVAESASTTSLALWVAILSIPIGGYVLQQQARPDRGIMVFSTLVAFPLIGLAFAPQAALPFAIAMGLLIGPPPGAMMAMPGRALRPDNRAVGLGLFLTAYYVAVAVGPSLLGLSRDAYGASAPVVIGAMLFLSILPLTALFGILLRPKTLSTRAAVP